MVAHAYKPLNSGDIDKKIVMGPKVDWLSGEVRASLAIEWEPIPSKTTGAGEIAKWLKAVAVISDDLRLTPNIHMASHNQLVYSYKISGAQAICIGKIAIK